MSSSRTRTTTHGHTARGTPRAAYSRAMSDLAHITRQDVLDVLLDPGSGRLDPEVPSPFGVVHDGRTYDADAVLHAAYDRASGGEIDAEDLEDDRTAALLLRGLGFEVQGPELPPLRFTKAATVGREHAHATWALAARERLMETARSYHSTITYPDLAAFVQRRSLIKTSAAASTWIGDVLGRVASDCKDRREPLLSSLVVDASGHVGDSYSTAVWSLRGEQPEDPDAHAAVERLECHRHFGAELPEGGGEPAVVARNPAPRAERAVAGAAAKKAPRASRAVKKPEVVEKPLVTCPIHFTTLSPGGICDYCD